MNSAMYQRVIRVVSKKITELEKHIKTHKYDDLFDGSYFVMDMERSLDHLRMQQVLNKRNFGKFLNDKK